MDFGGFDDFGGFGGDEEEGGDEFSDMFGQILLSTSTNC